MLRQAALFGGSKIAILELLLPNCMSSFHCVLFGHLCLVSTIISAIDASRRREGVTKGDDSTAVLSSVGQCQKLNKHWFGLSKKNNVLVPITEKIWVRLQAC